MPYIITSDNPRDIIALFIAPRFDQHVRAYRQHRYREAIRADLANSDALFADMAAGLRALRPRKLFATETNCSGN